VYQKELSQNVDKKGTSTIVYSDCIFRLYIPIVYSDCILKEAVKALSHQFAIEVLIEGVNGGIGFFD